MTAACFPVWALDEVSIVNVKIQEQSYDRYIVSATIANKTAEPREATLRAQVFFFDKVSPYGDKPLSVLRKDATIVLKARESRKVRVLLIDEGSVAKQRVRLEPEIRLRRQRVWNY